MVDIGKKQATKFGAELKEDTVTNITGEAGSFVIETESGTSYEAENIIIATGALTNLAESIGIDTKDHREPRFKTAISVNEDGETTKKGFGLLGQ